MFEIKFERRSLKHKFRKMEHHAASKLAKVEMELWSHFKDDIQESHEASGLLKSLQASYDQLQSKMQESIEETTMEAGLVKEKADFVTEKAMLVLADHREAN